MKKVLFQWMLDTRDLSLIPEPLMRDLSGDRSPRDVLADSGYLSRLLPVKNGSAGQLYNMVEDPLESNNLVFTKKQIVEDLSSLLKELVDRGYSRSKD